MGRPYHYTSADVIFAVYADRAGIPEPDRAAARAEFYARPQPCLRPRTAVALDARIRWRAPIWMNSSLRRLGLTDQRRPRERYVGWRRSLSAGTG